ncbi:hypothetical protein ALC57_02735 [Trachymyrmex cornetzi]|uniref:Uncharacterized protein n=1 Tax=Trachymyrmex cornetzi TaxID=471704 RepID=A0A151JND1_9HYME|nr:hypothetical protein ALC57_02735 [Trachymyrmex cornetzi]
METIKASSTKQQDGTSGAGGQERRVSMRLHRRDTLLAAAGEMQPKSK